MIRNLLSNFSLGLSSKWNGNSTSSIPNHESNLLFQVETLESRQMLSGNVLATFAGDTLMIDGDANNSHLQVAVVGNDTVLVGENGTTINGSQKHFVLAANSTSFDGNVRASLNQGDDRLMIEPGVQIEGWVFIFAGEGDDSIGLDEVNVQGTIKLRTGNGNDIIALRNSQVNNLAFDSGSGDDTFSVLNTQVSGRLKGVTGKGADTTAIEDSTIERQAHLRTGAGDDDLVVKNSTFGKNLISNAGAGDDVTWIENSSVAGLSLFLMKSGDDALIVEGENQFARKAVIIGGLGNDVTQVASDVKASNEKTFGIESEIVPATLIEARLNSDVGALAKTALAQEVFADPNIDAEPLSLTVDLSQNELIPSNGTLISVNSSLIIVGKTSANATVAIARDADGLFDDGTVIANENGDYSISIELVNNNPDFGANHLQIRTSNDAGESLVEAVAIHYAEGTVVRYSTPLGDFDVELLNEEAPETVENFLSYLERFENSIIHRSPSINFVQGGSFTFKNGEIERITASDPIEGDFNPDNRNLRGTLSMALIPNAPDSGTSSWFFNTIDQPRLDLDLHTVFGRVIGSGIEIIEAIDELPDFDADVVSSSGAFNSLPLRNYESFSAPLTGTLNLSSGSSIVTGAGTLFTTEIPQDNRISIDGQVFVVQEIISDTSLVLAPSSVPALDITSDIAAVNQVPGEQNYVLLSISQIANQQ